MIHSEKTFNDNLRQTFQSNFKSQVQTGPSFMELLKHKQIMLTRIRLPAKLPCHMYNSPPPMWLVSCHFCLAELCVRQNRQVYEIGPWCVVSHEHSFFNVYRQVWADYSKHKMDHFSTTHQKSSYSHLQSHVTQTRQQIGHDWTRQWELSGQKLCTEKSMYLFPACPSQAWNFICERAIRPF